MPEKQSINFEKIERLPFSGVGASSLAASGLPSDLQREASRRLGLACLIYAIAFLFAYFFGAFYDWFAKGQIPAHLQGIKPVVASSAIALSLALYLLSRSGKLKPAALLDLGLIFEVVGAFGIAMTTIYGAFPAWPADSTQSIRYLGIPWECIWIVMFPVIAPNTPGKTLIASLAAASAGLITVLISKSTGATSAEAPMAWFLNYYLFSTYLCVVLAVFTSQLIKRFGAHLKKARQVGQYRLLERLGKGGMGEVWLARHHMLARPAAIKLIRPEVLGGDQESRRDVLKRFEREAQATAMLQSTHTIDLYDFGLTREGVFYYVMELLDGMDLDSLVQRFGPLPAARVISFLRQACHSLKEAHGDGMIHRDIKPANLYVCRLGPDHDFIKLLDFGLVKHTGDQGEEGARLTREGVTFGTPACMAPEMALCSGEVDARTDIYALGCVGYWLLTGKPVFTGDTPLSVVLHHVKTDPLPPSECSEIDVPADLEQVILACLAKDPAVRPQSARELESMLAVCALTTDWSEEQAAEWWDLHLPRRATRTDGAVEPG